MAKRRRRGPLVCCQRCGSDTRSPDGYCVRCKGESADDKRYEREWAERDAEAAWRRKLADQYGDDLDGFGFRESED